MASPKSGGRGVAGLGVLGAVVAAGVLALSLSFGGSDDDGDAARMQAPAPNDAVSAPLGAEDGLTEPKPVEAGADPSPAGGVVAVTPPDPEPPQNPEALASSEVAEPPAPSAPVTPSDLPDEVEIAQDVGATPSPMQTPIEPEVDAPDAGGGPKAVEAAPAVGDAGPGAPQFDVVRIDRSGSALVAGRAAPDSIVEIVADGRLIAEATAGPDGAFLAMFDVDPDAKAQEVTARIAKDTGGESGGLESSPLLVLSDEAGESAPIVVQPSSEGVRIVQPAAAPVVAEVTLDTISYGDDGRVSFSGRGSDGDSVTIYLDDRAIAETALGADRSWRAQPENRVEPGIYTLRVDETDSSGGVVSRLETPFQRESITQGEIGERTLTVQRGNNLWKLAEGIYGQGVRYTLIYEANADAIRDPDLIYPGQIFRVPDARRSP